MYKTICYLSTPNKNLSLLEYEELFFTTKKNNDRLNICGALIKTEDVFFQIIEGEINTIDTLFYKIKKDLRHKNIIEMLNQQIGRLAFSNFGVGYSIINDEDTIRELYKYINSQESENGKNTALFSNIISKLVNVDV